MIRIFFSLVMLFSLSCSRVESLDMTDNMTPYAPLEINASTVVTSTKGALVSTPEDMGSIGLFCEMTGNGVWETTTSFTKMNDQRYYISSDKEWLIDGETITWGYEYLTDKYTFFAYSPYYEDTQGVTPRIEAGELVIDYVAPSNSIDQPDLMFATPRKDIYAQVTNGVSLNFHHTLASVSFDLISTTGEKITAIEIKGIVSEGSLKWDYELDAPKWSYEELSSDYSSAEADSFSVKIKSDYTLNDYDPTQLNTEQGYLMMIPQVLTYGAEVLITIDNGDERSLTIPAGSEWEAGVEYNYVIMFEEEREYIYNSEQISNCYIINPTPGKETIVQIPIEDRINDFWLNYSGENCKKIFTSSIVNEFTVSMMWEDFDGDFSFGYTVLDDADKKMAVSLTIPAEFQEGNFVFAVKKDNSILWSWHLWFTDYNPDAIATANQSKIVADTDMAYERIGYEGAVHRYKDANNSIGVWSDIYKDKFIMDRNIGERNEYAANYGAGAVYYQFGRKDPFPGNGATYSSGDTQPFARSSSGFSFVTSVEFCYDYFITSSSSDNWSVESAARLFSCMWFDKSISNSGYTEGKSIFDPSPLGWRVPVSDTWSYFNNTGSTQEGCDKTKSVGIYNCYGYRDLDKATLSKAGEVGSVWSANPLDPETGYCLYYTSSSVLSPSDLLMTYGLPVRAVQE